MATNISNLGRSSSWKRDGEMAITSSQRSAFFRRDLVQHGDRWLVESTCRTCGAVIVGSVMDTLPDDEENHISQCSLGDQLAAGGGAGAEGKGTS